jgi:hypothetical protein
VSLNPSNHSVVRFFNLYPLSEAERICGLLHRMNRGVSAQFLAREFIMSGGFWWAYHSVSAGAKIPQ